VSGRHFQVIDGFSPFLSRSSAVGANLLVWNIDVANDSSKLSRRWIHPPTAEYAATTFHGLLIPPLLLYCCAQSTHAHSAEADVTRASRQQSVAARMRGERRAIE
jgi:hypothetical protein